MSRLSHHCPPLHPHAGCLKYWPDKAEETENSHESQASRALLDTPGMSPQPGGRGGPPYQATGMQRYGEPSCLWGQSTMGYSPHKQGNDISILHRKKWKSWAVIFWLDLFVKSYLINIQFLGFTSNPRKPSEWSLGESWVHRTNTTVKHFHK